MAATAICNDALSMSVLEPDLDSMQIQIYVHQEGNKTDKIDRAVEDVSGPILLSDAGLCHAFSALRRPGQ
jgi:hypothetical protein